MTTTWATRGRSFCACAAAGATTQASAVTASAAILHRAAAAPVPLVPTVTASPFASERVGARPYTSPSGAATVSSGLVRRVTARAREPSEPARHGLSAEAGGPEPLRADPLGPQPGAHEELARRLH